MPKRSNALAALAAVLLAACGSQQGESAGNAAVESVAGGNGSNADPGQGGVTVDRVVEPVAQQPPDAVSHPEGYLPPAPDEAEPAGTNSSPADESLPATEDQYMRNKQ